MNDDTLKVFTFTLIDGRKVSYEGLTEGQAFNRANAYQWLADLH